MSNGPKDVTAGLRMMADEFRRNAERSMSIPQQLAMSGRAMIAEAGANEIDRLRELLSHGAPQSSDSGGDDA
jgi:hypothetical protein